ncbi:hypothetical protein ACFC07_22285 [Streptomyces sp. NPDC056099]|uniref:hypothetical protein n=1 Tax=unclassified Streptomyces TaxID=2593676 RepID=UPI0035E276F7
MNRPLTRRTRAAVAAAVATGLLILAASVTSTYDGANAGATVGPAGCFLGIEWRGEPGLYGSCSGTDPDADPDPDAALVTAFNDGFVDGQADARGDDNRDGRVDEDESGWDCRTMGNRTCGTDTHH